jgi:hypothetical protein
MKCTELTQDMVHWWWCFNNRCDQQSFPKNVDVVVPALSLTFKVKNNAPVDMHFLTFGRFSVTHSLLTVNFICAYRLTKTPSVTVHCS